jgi:hypothetical protein
VAANLLSHALPLLRKLRVKTGSDIAFKIDIKAILDTICSEVVETDVPHDLRACFPNASEVVKVFNLEYLRRSFRRRAAVERYINGSWTKIFTLV